MEFRSSINPMHLLVAGACMVLLLPALFMDGMFMDGVLYASVSKNYALGKGSFWFMTFSDTFHKDFHEQPPLMFVLQGLFFKAFGTSLYVERLYCLVAAGLNAWLIARAWRLLTGDKETNWLPILLWFVMPVTFWAFTNNVEECTMSVFALLALNAVLRAVFTTREKNYWWIIAGAWILAAGLTKGVQGMFLLSAPLWCWLILKNGGVTAMFRRFALIGLVPASFVLLAWFTPAIKTSFTAYFLSRYVKTFNNITANSNNHFHLLFELLLDTLPVLAFLAICFLAARKTPEFFTRLKTNRRTVIFLLACGLSGILPMLITREQRGFYLVTALPMLALAAALLVHPVAVRMNAFLNSRVNWGRIIAFSGFVIILGALWFTFMNAGEPKRDADKIAALHEIAGITGDNATLRSSHTLNADWSFLTYGQRYHGLSFTDKDLPENRWLITEKGEAVPPDYTSVPLNSGLYSLYTRK